MYGIIRRTKCGYCSAEGNSQYLGARAHRLTCDDYQALIDRGWRRSGNLLYLTDHKKACCAYYTIRTSALEAKLSSSDKKLLRKWRKIQRSEETQQHTTVGNTTTSTDSDKDDLVDSVLSSASGAVDMRIESASFSEEKYKVFERYQREIHNDKKPTRHGFRDFLCSSPLIPQRISTPASTKESKASTQQVLPNNDFGSYHQCYYIKNRLVAVGVIDILPKCVSSVYLFYDTEFSYLSLGSYSSLREIALVRQLHRYVHPDINYYYMGYYIPSCSKMTYKARWRPSDMLDLVTMHWIPIERCLERIRQHPLFTSFDPAIDSLNLVRDCTDDELQFSPVLSLESIKCAPGWDSSDEEELHRLLGSVVIWVRSGAVQSIGIYQRVPITLAQLTQIGQALSNFAFQIVAGLGNDLAKRMIISA
ncbi:Arginyl-tRNA--protein transferase 1 [Coemansia spiralis]|uniref:Arginyl-tRNA--protein transferase 1 n=1 Tax=Coemansia spiralis TaxID=417178 RepID=A0A9W8GCY2_9FUNG|nr:Arginyl-tRNA--protein transferase 1 [Coemansia spiralis]